jgi:formylmethanofuran dehydrogenase subunit E
MYGYTKGLGDTISCDDCNEIVENWFVGEGRAICGNCYGVIV